MARPLYVASAEDDDWADLRGEFLATQASGAVYRLLRPVTAELAQLPPVNTPAGNVLRYHVRTRGHGLTAFNWSQYLEFADQWVGSRR